MDITEIFDREQSILSTFSGIRGIERGLELAGIKTRAVAYVEKEAFVCENLVQEMETTVLDSAPIWTDIESFDGRPFHNKIHGITGGYPCTPFSQSGKMRGTSDQRWYWKDIARIISESRPIWGFFENVPNHLNEGFSDVLFDLTKAGYTVEAGLFNSVEVSSRHLRKRLFILAVENSRINHKRRKIEFIRWTKKIERSQNDLQVRITDPGSTLHVAVPGHKKREWEAPYTSDSDQLKSDLGLPTDGHGYITDILSAIGNSVQPHTAAFAFLTLLKRVSQ